MQLYVVVVVTAQNVLIFIGICASEKVMLENRQVHTFFWAHSNICCGLYEHK